MLISCNPAAKLQMDQSRLDKIRQLDLFPDRIDLEDNFICLEDEQDEVPEINQNAWLP